MVASLRVGLTSAIEAFGKSERVGHQAKQRCRLMPSSCGRGEVGRLPLMHSPLALGCDWRNPVEHPIAQQSGEIPNLGETCKVVDRLSVTFFWRPTLN